MPWPSMMVVLELFEQEEPELFFGKRKVDEGEGNAVEGEVP